MIPAAHFLQPIFANNRILDGFLTNQAGEDNSIASDDLPAGNSETHHHSFGELMVDQFIETIEYLLGSISNTASYLRLWALSLAHGQLSKVFYTMILSSAIKDSTSIISSTITLVIGFVMFFVITFAVILIMDSMECFLHGLRLHWVEFQNKFFKGDGLPFVNFKHDVENNN